MTLAAWLMPLICFCIFLSALASKKAHLATGPVEKRLQVESNPQPLMHEATTPAIAPTPCYTPPAHTTTSLHHHQFKLL